MWISPFYILVTFPYVVLASEFGDQGERIVYKTVNTLNGNLGSANLINESDIISASLVAFLIVNVIAEFVLYLRPTKTVITARTAVMTKLLICVLGWTIAATVSVSNRATFDDVLFHLAAAGLSVALFMFEFMARKIMSAALTIVR